MLSVERAAQYYQILIEIRAETQIEPKQRLSANMALLRDLLNELTKNDLQFFSSLYSKHVYLSNKFTLDEKLVRTINKFFAINSDLRKTGSVVVSEQQDLELNSAIAACVSAYSSSEIPPQLVGSNDFKKEAFSRAVREIPLEFSHAVESQKEESISEKLSSFRMTVASCSEIQAKGSSVRCSLLGRSREDEDVILYLWDEHTEFATLLREGSTVFVHQVRELAPQHYSSAKQTLLVLEPDILIDVTDVAECFQGTKVEPLLYFLRRYSQHASSQAMAIGSLINYCFDEVLAHDSMDFDEMFDAALRSKALSMIAGIGTENLDLVRDLVHTQVDRLREVRKTMVYSRAITEPSFIAPCYGLQGRLDVMLEYDEEPSRKTIIELKSGSAPAIRAEAKNTEVYIPRAMWPNHLAQITCYNLLLDSAYPGRSGDSQLLYSKAETYPLRDAPNVISTKRSVLQCRNVIVYHERRLIDRNFAVLNALCGPELQVPSYMQKDLAAFCGMMKSLALHERRYLQAFVSFLVREQYAQKIGLDGRSSGFASLWMDSQTEKVERMSILSHLLYDVDGSDTELLHLRFHFSQFTSAYSNFRVGDIVILYPMQDDGSVNPLLGQIIKCSVRVLDAESIVVSLRNKQIPPGTFTKSTYWVLEPDFIESSSNSIFGWFFGFFSCEPEVRSMMLGLSIPQTKANQPVELTNLTQHQNTILNAALSTSNYYLIQGPPGTGKTSVMLSSIVSQCLLDSEEALLVAAFTNRAVDEICRALKDKVDNRILLRMGTKENTEHTDLLFSTRTSDRDFRFAEDCIKQSRVIVATVSFLQSNAELFALKSFTTAIVDEAAQILEPQLIGLLSQVKRFILIGDEKQLPAVVTQNESACIIDNEQLASLGIRDLRVSLFERLLERCIKQGWTHAYGMLEQQARMHRSIQDMSSTMFYDSRLKPLHSWQEEPSIVATHGHETTFESLLGRSPLIYIRTRAERRSKINHAEAQVCKRIINGVWSNKGSDFKESTLGIISPFRAQIREISRHIDANILKNLSIDTVERFQGSERDIIVLSTALNSASMLSSMQSLTHHRDRVIDRKLNVALTRARHQFILVGNESLLRQSSEYNSLIDHIAQHGIVVDAEEFELT